MLRESRMFYGRKSIDSITCTVKLFDTLKVKKALVLRHGVHLKTCFNLSFFQLCSTIGDIPRVFTLFLHTKMSAPFFPWFSCVMWTMVTLKICFRFAGYAFKHYWKHQLFLSDFNETWINSTDFAKYWNITFQENPSIELDDRRFWIEC